MDTILVKPKNKEELELVSTLMQKMNIRTSIQRKDLLKKQKAKKEFLDSLPARFEEVKLHMEGKLELKNARELLNEL
jgi:hypothetical protein